MSKLLLVSCFVLSALLMSTVSHCTEPERDVIVKDGLRVVVVEYDGDGKTNTRVFISPPGKEEDEKKTYKGETLQVEVDGDRNSNETGHEPHEVEEQKLSSHEVSKAQDVWEKVKVVVRRLGTVVAEELKLAKIGSVVGLMGIGVAYGMCVWVTFVSSYIMTPVLGRQQFGVVQIKVNLVYFKAVSVGILVGLLGHIISRRRKVLTDAVEMWQAVNLLSSVLVIEANGSFVEPRVTKAMRECIKSAKEDGRGYDTAVLQSSEAMVQTSVIAKRRTKLSERLERLNAYTSRLNLLTFMSLTWHVVYLGHRLSLTC